MAALVTDMDGPLGHAIGNALEVREAVETLQGQGPADLTELCLALAGHMLAWASAPPRPQTGKEMARAALEDGAGCRRSRRSWRRRAGRRDSTRRACRSPLPAPT